MDRGAIRPMTREHFLSDTDADPTVALFRVHESAVNRWLRTQQALADHERHPDKPIPFYDAAAEATKARWRTMADRERAFGDIRACRLRIRALDLTPPPLPAELQHLDEPPELELDDELGLHHQS